VCEGPLSKAGDAREDFVGTPGPHERLGLFIADVDEFSEGALEFTDAPVGAASQLFGRHLARKLRRFIPKYNERAKPVRRSYADPQRRIS
jgi:hypothetical protein